MREYTIFYEKEGKKKRIVVSTTADLLSELGGATIKVHNVLQHTPKKTMPESFESLFGKFKK